METFPLLVPLSSAEMMHRKILHFCGKLVSVQGNFAQLKRKAEHGPVVKQYIYLRTESKKNLNARILLRVKYFDIAVSLLLFQ